MKTKHTPGNWEIKEEYEGYAIVAPDGNPGTVYVAKNIEQGRDFGLSDAKLIAAAPKLLEALQGLWLPGCIT